MGTASAAFIVQDPDIETAVKISADGRTAMATNFDGLFARVAVVTEHDGKTGLQVMQADIDRNGRIEIPQPNGPGVDVKAVCVALVPTFHDIMSETPDYKAFDYIIL